MYIGTQAIAICLKSEWIAGGQILILPILFFLIPVVSGAVHILQIIMRQIGYASRS